MSVCGNGQHRKGVRCEYIYAEGRLHCSQEFSLSFLTIFASQKKRVLRTVGGLDTQQQQASVAQAQIRVADSDLFGSIWDLSRRQDDDDGNRNRRQTKRKLLCD